MKSSSVFTLLAAVATMAGSASALPTVGDTRPMMTLTDAWERQLAVTAKANKPILVVYEDKDSAAQNDILKKELANLARGGRYRSAVTLLAIADLGAYDYWPVKGFVKDAVQSESVKIDTPIYCDWDGSARKAMGLKKGVSNIVLYGRDGKVLLAHEGAMDKDRREKLLQLVRAQLKPSS